MMVLIAGGIAGLVLGMAIQRCGLTDRGNVSGAIALNKRSVTKCLLWGVGLGTVLTAFLCWLAVIDVDWLTVLPLHGGTVVGGVIFGAAAGLTGLLMGTAPAVIGGGRFLEGLCGAVGCAAGAALLPYVSRLSDRVTALIPTSANTLFQVTLDEPFLFGGGFLGQACVGAVMMAVAVLLRSEVLPEPAAEPIPDSTPPVSTDAETVQEETVVISLPEEEPVVVDTSLAEEPAGEEASDEAASGEGDAAVPLEDLAEDEPVTPDHPELEASPESTGDWTEDMARLEEAAGQGTPLQEEALPVGAKAVGDPERRDAEDEPDAPPGEDHLG